jgi:GNAT superfamily N-acetyltransferase
VPAYRFCRPDDIPRLVRAVHECFEPHFPDLEPLTVEGFRREMKEISLWPSNSMLALGSAAGETETSGEDGDDAAVGVLTATKREHEVLITRVGVRPGHQRRGHGSHMLTSLSQKLAVLGPPRLAAEVPAHRDDLLAFFTACGYRSEATYTDWRRPPGPPPDLPVKEELVVRVDVPGLVAGDLLEVPDGVAWERTRETLEARADRLHGFALADASMVAAWLLMLEEPDAAPEVLGIRISHGFDEELTEMLYEMILRHVVRLMPEREICCPKLLPGEVPESVLRELGFEPRTVYARMTAEATPQ